MLKNNTKIIIGAVIVVLLGAWYAVKVSAEKEARNAIYDSALDDLIEFDDLSVGLMDKSITLYDVELSTMDEDKAPAIEAITLIGFDHLSDWVEEEADFPEVLSIQITGLQYNLHEMLRNNATPIDLNDKGLITSLILYGYQFVDADVGIQVNYDKDDQLLNLKISTNADGVSQVIFESEFSNVRKKLLDTFRFDEDLDLDKNPMNALGSMMGKLAKLKKNLGKVALNHMSIEVDDDGLMERVKYYDSMENFRLPGESDSSLFDEDKQKKEIASLVKRGLPKSFVKALVLKTADFFESPGTIKVETDIDSPLRFSKLMDSKSSDKFIKRLNLRVD